MKRKGRRREAGSEGSVEQVREPMDKNRIRGGMRRTSEPLIAKSISIKGAERTSGGGAQKAVGLTSGGLHRVPGSGTEEAARRPDRGAGVRRGHSRRVGSVHSIGALVRKERNGRDRRTGNDATEGPNGEGASRPSDS